MGEIIFKICVIAWLLVFNVFYFVDFGINRLQHNEISEKIEHVNEGCSFDIDAVTQPIGVDIYINWDEIELDRDEITWESQVNWFNHI